jgi:hypothetical protein
MKRRVVERQFDPVIGDAVLREIVGADLFAAFAGADLVFAVGGILCVLLATLCSNNRERRISEPALFFC